MQVSLLAREMKHVKAVEPANPDMSDEEDEEEEEGEVELSKHDSSALSFVDINGTDEGESQTRRLLSSRSSGSKWSAKYKFEKVAFGMFGIKIWKKTSYRWCVENTIKSFPRTIGKLEFWDNDRIKRDGSYKKVNCADRTDIGTGTCKYEKGYLFIYDLYMC